MRRSRGLRGDLPYGLFLVIALACGGSPPSAPVGKRPPATRAPATAEPAEEPETDDEVQVTPVHGRMDPTGVNAGLAAHRAALTACYTQNVGDRRWLGGHVLVRWDVAADGKITRVLLTASDLGAWPIEKCVLDVARAATFGKPIGGAAELTLPLEFTPPVQPPQWDVLQSARAVGGQLVKLADCARGDKRVRVPDEIAITMYVGPHGRPESVGFASARTALDDSWAACAEKAALAWRLPDPKGQVTKLAVRYRPR